jgi:cation transporter-like permease
MTNENMQGKLQELQKIKRFSYHPLVHHIYETHKISKKTLFYVKEYGEHTNVAKTIIKESLKILLLTSILSSIGGFTIEHIKTIFISIVPLVILLPALNDMVGDYGTILSSRFSTMLHKGTVGEKWWDNEELRLLFVQVLVIAILTTIISAAVALAISSFSGNQSSIEVAGKVFAVSLIDVCTLILLMFFVSISAGIYFFKRGEDPNNFLIPITTSIADFGNMILLSLLIIIIF